VRVIQPDVTFSDQPANTESLMVLVWQVGSVFVHATLAAFAGRYILNWTSIIGFARQAAIR